MADSLREGIMVAIVAALDGVGKPAGTTIHRMRPGQLPLDKDDLPAIAVYILADTPERSDHDLTVWRSLQIRLEHRVTAAVNVAESVDKLLDPSVSWGTSALMNDGPLAALITDIEENKTVWDESVSDSLLGAAGQDFTLTYTTLEGDQEST